MPDRRANHEGSKPVKRSDGRYQCRVVIGSKTRFFTGATASIAREKMRAWLRSPEAVDPAGQAEHRNVTDILDAYVDETAPVFCESQKMCILKVMDHKEYDKKRWVKECECHDPKPPQKTNKKSPKRRKLRGK